MTIGGAVIGWIDEYWKGRVIDSVKFDNRSDAMADRCPDPWAEVQQSAVTRLALSPTRS